MKKVRKAYITICALPAAVLLSIALSSCIVPTATPQEAFRSHMQYNVGRNIDDSSTNWVRPENLIEVKSLPNGNDEYKYRDRGTCRYYFEVKRETRTIVGWRLEGEQDCKINPV